MILRYGLIAVMLMLTWSCSGDDGQPPQEPVAPTQQVADKVPDAPGQAGLTAEKAAGEGQAAAAQAEKSQPNMDEAKAAAAKAMAAGKAGAEKAMAAAKSDKAGTTAEKAPMDMVVVPGALNVRSGRGTKNPAVRIVKKGEHVKAQDCKTGWCKIGDNEYVSQKFLAPAK